jgi:ABC-2 type transport system ATP-binding protein
MEQRRHHISEVFRNGEQHGDERDGQRKEAVGHGG